MVAFREAQEGERQAIALAFDLNADVILIDNS
jgi:predicted nucleic acid-binding protein